MRLVVFVLVVVVASISLCSAANTVFLIRHGEKPASGDTLSKQGYERAECLVDVFGRSGRYPNVSQIYACPPTDGHGKSMRAVQTVTPLATYLNMPVMQTYNRDEHALLAQNVLLPFIMNGQSDANNTMILVSWEHDALSQMLVELGAAADTWPDSQFDMIWKVSYDAANAKMIKTNDYEQCHIESSSHTTTIVIIVIVVVFVVIAAAWYFYFRHHCSCPCWRASSSAASSSSGATAEMESHFQPLVAKPDQPARPPAAHQSDFADYAAGDKIVIMSPPK